MSERISKGQYVMDYYCECGQILTKNSQYCFSCGKKATNISESSTKSYFEDDKKKNL